MGGTYSTYVEIRRFWWGNAGVDGKIILKWIFRNWVVGIWTESSWL
jgi:hypothetical protein